MTAVTTEAVLAAFLVFCRIGGCLLIMPGFSSMRIPVQVRLFMALAVSLTLTPVLLPFVAPIANPADPARFFAAIGSELGIGFTIGLLGRLMFMALQTMSVAAAQAIGLGGMMAGVADNGEQQPAVATLFTLTATVMIFAADQHWELLRGLLDSYSVVPPDGGFSPRLSLVDITDQLSAAFFLTLRITSPFLIYSVIVNLAVGITNKLTPQIPIYFIAMPFVTAGGLLLLYFSITEVLAIYSAAFGAWLQQG